MVRPNSCLNEPVWSTTQRLSFRQPTDRSRPNIRDKAKGADCPTFDSKMSRNTRPSTQASGFMTNYTTGDGAGWVPQKNLHTDQLRTSYRMSFNCEKPFHKTTRLFNDGRLPLKAVALDQDWKPSSQHKRI